MHQHSHTLFKFLGSAIPITVSLAPIEEPLKIVSLVIGIIAGILSISDSLARRWKK